MPTGVRLKSAQPKKGRAFKPGNLLFFYAGSSFRLQFFINNLFKVLLELGRKFLVRGKSVKGGFKGPFMVTAPVIQKKIERFFLALPFSQLLVAFNLNSWQRCLAID